MFRAMLILPVLLAGCASSGSELRRESAPELEQRELDLRAAEASRRDFRTVLLQLDQAIDSYVRAVSFRGQPHADAQADRLLRTIRQMVLDQGAVAYGKQAGGGEIGNNFARLQAMAIDGSVPADQALALVALGFSGVQSMMPTILAGAQLKDPFLVDRSVLGLAVLRAPGTPPGVLARIAEDQQHPEDGRVQAAWALYQLQSTVEDQGPYVAIWRRFLTEKRSDLPAGVLVSAVRGMGLARDDKNSDVVAPMLSHPITRLRMAACVALARMNAQSHVDDLIALLGPAETQENVRLHARKALADLAGGDDYNYDVAAWRKAFERGR